MIIHDLFWKNPHYHPFPSFKGKAECDYLIVGGGVAGVSLAYFLSTLGKKKVILVEKNMIASGATGHAAGSLVASAEVDVRDLVKRKGTKKAAGHWKLLGETLLKIKNIVKKEKISCEFEMNDTLYGGRSSSQRKKLDIEYSYLKKIDSRARIVEGSELSKLLDTPMFTRSIYSPSSGISVNPLKLTQGLAHAARRKGVDVYEQTLVEHTMKNVAYTPNGKIAFKKIIWTVDAVHANKHVLNCRTSIVITRKLSSRELARTGLKRKKIIWDAKENYGYAKVTKDNRLLIGFGGVLVHKWFNRKDTHIPHLVQAQKWLKKLFPYLDLKLEYAWSATYGVTRNHHVVVEKKGNVHSIAGAGSQLVCVMAAHELANKLLGKPHRLNLVYF